MTDSIPVSHWIGTGPRREDLWPLLEYSTTEAGDFVPCTFCEVVGINQYDPDDFGGQYFAMHLTNPRLLFADDASVPAIREAWPELPPSNCSVSLYRHVYDGTMREFSIAGFRFQFLGTFHCPGPWAPDSI